MHKKLEIIYDKNKPFGIRDSGGFLFFFPCICKYTGQEQRYRQEIFEQFELADYLLTSLKERATEIVEAKSEQPTTDQMVGAEPTQITLGSLHKRH